MRGLGVVGSCWLVGLLAGQVTAQEPQGVAVLTGKVIDAWGKPVAGVEVRVLLAAPIRRAGDRPGTTSIVTPPDWPRAVTDQEGKYRLSLTVDAEVVLVQLVTDENRYRRTTGGEATLTRDGEARAKDLVVLPLLSTLSGKVVDTRGTPVAGAEVFVRGYAQRGAARTADDGTFTLKGLPAHHPPVVALSGLCDRGELSCRPEDSPVVIKLGEPADQEMPLADVQKWLKMTIESVRGKPTSGWYELTVALARSDPEAAWAAARTLGDHWLRDRARQDLLLFAARRDPAAAVAQWPHFEEMTTNGLKMICSSWVAFHLAATHPQEAEAIYRAGFDCPQVPGSRLNMSLCSTGRLAAALALGHPDAKRRTASAAQAAAETEKDWRWLAYATAGWYLSAWPDVLEEVLGQCDDPALVKAAEMTSWQALSRRDPELALALFETSRGSLGGQRTTEELDFLLDCAAYLAAKDPREATALPDEFEEPQKTRIEAVVAANLTDSEAAMKAMEAVLPRLLEDQDPPARRPDGGLVYSSARGPATGLVLAARVVRAMHRRDAAKAEQWAERVLKMAERQNPFDHAPVVFYLAPVLPNRACLSLHQSVSGRPRTSGPSFAPLFEERALAAVDPRWALMHASPRPDAGTAYILLALAAWQSFTPAERCRVPLDFAAVPDPLMPGQERAAW